MFEVCGLTLKLVIFNPSSVNGYTDHHSLFTDHWFSSLGLGLRVLGCFLFRQFRQYLFQAFLCLLKIRIDGKRFAISLEG